MFIRYIVDFIHLGHADINEPVLGGLKPNYIERHLTLNIYHASVMK